MVLLSYINHFADLCVALQVSAHVPPIPRSFITH